MLAGNYVLLSALLVNSCTVVY